MSIDTAAREQKVREALSEISHIATLPEITMQIINLVEDATSTAQDLQEVISNDPALSSRILKVVNSSFYGLPGQVGSINRAIVMLGLNAVKNIAIAASLAKLFRGGDLTPQFSAKMLWSHSNAVAICCKVFNDKLKLGLGDEAYLSGLMHDLGIMLEMQFDRNLLIDVIGRTGPGRRGRPGERHADRGRGRLRRHPRGLRQGAVHPVEVPGGVRGGVRASPRPDVGARRVPQAGVPGVRRGPDLGGARRRLPPRPALDGDPRRGAR
jgi:hypothetical protein